MYRLHSIMRNILIVSFTALLLGCDANSTNSSDTSNQIETHSTISSDTYAYLGTKAQHQGQVKDSITGEGLENVHVSIGSHTATTDAEGYYAFSDLKETEKTVVNFGKEGYLLGSRKIQIKELYTDSTLVTNYLEYSMESYDKQWSYESQISTSTSNIDIPESIYIDTTGEGYNGSVSALLKILDITTDKDKALFPGSFEGIDSNGQIVQFVSYGLISLSFQDANGNTLKFLDNTQAKLKFDAVPSYQRDDIIALWYYDYTQGLWIEEGYAERQSDGTYLGEISHPGTWSLNKSVERDLGIFRAHIIDKDGEPISNVRVSAIGKNWVSSDLSTDEDGLFEIHVVPDASFKLSAYNYEDKYGATYDATIPAIASGDILDDH